MLTCTTTPTSSRSAVVESTLSLLQQTSVIDLSQRILGIQGIYNNTYIDTISTQWAGSHKDRVPHWHAQLDNAILKLIYQVKNTIHHTAHVASWRDPFHSLGIVKRLYEADFVFVLQTITVVCRHASSRSSSTHRQGGSERWSLQAFGPAASWIMFQYREIGSKTHIESKDKEIYNTYTYARNHCGRLL